jgi:hypothetical protein
MNVDGLPVPKVAAAETERESAIEAILSDTKTAMTRGTPSLVLHMRPEDPKTRCPASCPGSSRYPAWRCLASLDPDGASIKRNSTAVSMRCTDK